MHLIKAYVFDMGEWNYVLYVSVSNFTGFTIITYRNVFCSSVTFICKEQLIYDNPNFEGNQSKNILRQQTT